MCPVPAGIGVHGYPLPIEVLVFGNRRTTLLIVLVRVVGVDTVACLAHALAVCVVNVAFGWQPTTTDAAQAIFMIPSEILLGAQPVPAGCHVTIGVVQIALRPADMGDSVATIAG